MNVQVEFGGKDAGLFAVADSVKRRINDLTAAGQRTKNSQEAINRLEQQLASIETQRARQAWDRLTTEQKITQLKEKQVSLDKAAQRAGEGTLLARGIELKQGILSAQIAQLQSGKGSGFAGMLSGVSPILSSMGLGTAGAFLGGAVGGGIGVAVGTLISALFSSAQSAMEFADEIDDAATTLRMNNEETLRLFRAAAASGLSSGAATGALSKLESVRASAAGGDMASLQLLRRYGVTPEMINNQDLTTLAIAQTIRKSLGQGGMLTEDKNSLSKLFGRRPEKMVSIVGQLGETTAGPGIEEDLKILGEGQDFKEQFLFAMKDKSLRLWAYAGRLYKNNPYSVFRRMFHPTEGPPAGVTLGDRTAAPAPSVSIDSENMSTWEDYQTLLEADKSSRKSLPRGASMLNGADNLTRMGLYNAGGVDSMANIAKNSLDSLRRIEGKLDTLNREVSAE